MSVVTYVDLEAMPSAYVHISQWWWWWWLS